MKLSELIAKLTYLMIQNGDLEVLDNEFQLPINKVEVEGMMRGKEPTGTFYVVIGRDE